MNWEVTIRLLEDGTYKVTRRLPEYSLAETKIFENKNDAMQQFHEWLDFTNDAQDYIILLCNNGMSKGNNT